MSRSTSGRYKFKCMIDGRVSETFRMYVELSNACPGLAESAQHMADHIVEQHPSGAVIEMIRIGHGHYNQGDDE